MAYFPELHMHLRSNYAYKEFVKLITVQNITVQTIKKQSVSKLQNLQN